MKDFSRSSGNKLPNAEDEYPSHIYWFAFYNEQSPSVRYRAIYPLRYFKEKFGIDYSLVIPGYNLRNICHFARVYFGILFFRKRNSLIVIQRIHSHFIYANLLKFLILFRSKATVYDLDDADYLEVRNNNIFYFAKKCRVVSAGSAAIANFLRAYNPNIVFTTSPTPDLNITKSSKNRMFTIGWIGGFGGDHKRGLIEQVFPAICQLDFPLKLVLLGVQKATDCSEITAYFSPFKHIELCIPKDIDWTDEPEIQRHIVQFDIGLATLLNTEIQLAKSGIKAKQYLNNGIPVLSTPLAENSWVVSDGQNGYFCTDTEAFKQRLIEFQAMDEERYLHFSQQARHSNTTFNHDSYFNSILQLYAKSID